MKADANAGHQAYYLWGPSLLFCQFPLLQASIPLRVHLERGRSRRGSGPSTLGLQVTTVGISLGQGAWLPQGLDDASLGNRS